VVKFSKPAAQSNLDGLLSRYLKKKRLQMILPFIPTAARILDIGCDNGALLEHLPAFECYLGLDSRETVITRNREHYKQTNVSFACVNFDDFAWPGPPFNLVVMTAVLEHLQGIDPALERLQALVAENGLLLITTPCPLSRFVLHAGAAVGLFARDSLSEHKNYFRKSDFQHLPEWKLDLYKRFEFGLNQLLVLRKLFAPRHKP
jgi:2-polyprenyl-3-methyl-5-hydroxy-6-metoxy-1,4-benzoquinol methylase